MINMMMFLQIASVLLMLAGSALSASSKKSQSISKYLDVILAKGPKGPLPVDSQVESLMLLRRDLNQAYNLTYQVKDPEGRIMYRQEYGDGSGALYGSMNFTTDKGTRKIIRYSLQVEEHVELSWKPDPIEVEIIPSMSSSPQVNQMSKQSFKENRSWRKHASKADQKLKSTSMDNSWSLYQRERVFPFSRVMKGGGSFGDFQTLSSRMVENYAQTPDSYDNDMKEPVVVSHMKPKSRGYEQKWVKGQGLVVDREYELPYDYRTGIQHHSAFQDNEDQKPFYVHQTKPTVKIDEVTRALDGNSKIPQMYRSDNKQQNFEVDNSEELLYMTHSKPGVKVHVVTRALDGNSKIPQMYRSDNKQQELKDDINEELLYMTHSKPEVKLHEETRALDGNSKIPQTYRSDNKQQELEDDSSEELQYMTRSKPEVKVAMYAPNGGKNQDFKNDSPELKGNSQYFKNDIQKFGSDGQFVEDYSHDFGDDSNESDSSEEISWPRLRH